MNAIKKCKTQVFEFLIEHPFCDALYQLFKYRSDEKFLKGVANRDGNTLRVNTLGDENYGEILYLIKNGDKNNGFFATYRETLQYLEYAERCGFKPIIVWNSDIPYAEEEEIFETKNPWEYYFAQPYMSVEQMNNSVNVIYSDCRHINGVYNQYVKLGYDVDYYLNDAGIERLAYLEKKYISIRSELQKEIDEDIGCLLKDDKVVGIHFRGTDFRNNYNLHPLSLEVEDYYEDIEKILIHGYDKIFVATDDAEAIKMMKERYGDKVIYYQDVLREKGNVSVAFCESERSMHRYLLGKEVLRDVLTLAKCSSLVAGVSQVSIAARVRKISQDEKYDYCRIISKGINQNTKHM